MKKCVEDAKIGTLRADWRGRWVSLSVDLLNIKKNGVGGVCIMWSLIDNQLLRERSLITCGGGSESLPQKQKFWIGHRRICIRLIEVPLS